MRSSRRSRSTSATRSACPITTSRTNTPAPGADTDVWLVRCSSGCTSAAQWSETQVAGPFDMEQAPDAGGLFVGDYEGMTTSGTAFQPFFIQAVSAPAEPDGCLSSARSRERPTDPTQLGTVAARPRSRRPCGALLVDERPAVLERDRQLAVGDRVARGVAEGRDVLRRQRPFRAGNERRRAEEIVRPPDEVVVYVPEVVLQSALALNVPSDLNSIV